MRRGGDKGLKFAEDRARALYPGKDRGAWCCLAAFGQKESRGVFDFDQTLAGHLKNTNFIGRPEAVFHGAQQAKLMIALAFEV